ncbi:hypothetical protein RND81_13G161400 [Saponaria officinalis]|uniref:Uncharacterized protein n=1 Tax=Saponaria officinalis TaxID=3572 RepID=A0AAW1H6H0_SAPOF
MTSSTLITALILVSCLLLHQAVATRQPDFSINPRSQPAKPEHQSTMPLRFPGFQEPIIPPHFFPVLPFPGMPSYPSGPTFPSLPSGPTFPTFPSGPGIPETSDVPPAFPDQPAAKLTGNTLHNSP